IGLLLWNAFCSVGGIFLIDRIGAQKPLMAGASPTVVLFGTLSGLLCLSDEHPNETGYAIGVVVVLGLMIPAYKCHPKVLRYSR
ncbi:hypothetical protein BHE90_017209, partial [Fusarium euwallaceae]